MNDPTVLIIGGGPAGLRAATELAPKVRGQVLVVEREAVAGGIPRHSDHPGYGLRDLHRFVSGPHYARMLRARAVAAGATLLEGAMVTGWAGERTVQVTSPAGRHTLSADAIVLATGARERPRSARLIPGDRSSGVYTTGHLQNLVHLRHGAVGRRAVIVGAELVSWSAALTLRHAGCDTVLMTTEYPKPDSYAVFSAIGRPYFRTTVATRTRVVDIHGRPSVTGVRIEHLDTGRSRDIECDTVILSGDWIGDQELARAAGLDLDPISRSPITDTALRTSRLGVFAAGNLLHPVDTADIAALDGVAVARSVLAHLDGARPDRAGVPLTAAPPLRWVTPGWLRPGDPPPPRNRLLAWSDAHVPFPTVVVSQHGRVLARRRVAWPAAPGRVFRIPADVLAHVDHNGGSVTIGLG